MMPDVVAHKAHQNNYSYLNSADLPLDSEFSMVGGYTENRENHKWGLAHIWALAQDNMVYHALAVY